MNPQSPQNNHQNNHYQNIQTQSGSSRYPILPPVQNPQHPQENPYNPQGNQAGYVAPGIYGNRQASQGPVVDSERSLNRKRMRELDQDLDSFFLKFYQGWLWLIVIVASLTSGKYLCTYLSGNSPPGRSDLIVGSVIYGLWSLVQSIFGLQAIYKKSLAKANAACWMMTIYLIPSLIIEVSVINWIRSYHPGPKDDDWRLWYGVMYFVLTCVTCHILAHVFVDMNGAFRVRKILAEKSVLQENLRDEDSWGV